MANVSLTDALPRFHADVMQQMLLNLANLPLTAAVRLGISRDFIAALQRMNVGELREFAVYYAQYHLTMQVDLAELHELVDQKDSERAFIQELLGAGASRPQLVKWFGLSETDISRLRYRYNLPHKGGDCYVIPPSERAKVKEIYQEHLSRWNDDAHAEARAMLSTSRTTGYSIPQVTRVIENRL